MDTRNNSYVLNNIGPWGDPLLAGIGGSASMVNMLEPLETAIPVIQNTPYSFQESLPQEKQETESGVTGLIIPDSVTAVRSILQAGANAASIDTDKWYDRIKTDAWGIFKVTSILIVCIILIVFGFLILTWPAQKIAIKEASKLA